MQSCASLPVAGRQSSFGAAITCTWVVDDSVRTCGTRRFLVSCLAPFFHDYSVGVASTITEVMAHLCVVQVVAHRIMSTVDYYVVHCSDLEWCDPLSVGFYTDVAWASSTAAPVV